MRESTTTTETSTATRQYDASLCPAWCAGDHLTRSESGDGFHHDSDAQTVAPASQQVRGVVDHVHVRVSRFDGATGEQPAQVELEDRARLIAGMTPAEARRLAGMLLQAADAIG